MASPLPASVLVKIDAQGRLVLPQALREGFVDTPGELLLRRTPDGLLLSPTTAAGSVRIAADGLPVLDLDRSVTNAEALAAIGDERQAR